MRWVVAALVCGAANGAESLIENGDFPKASLAPWKLFSIKDEPAPEKAIADGVLSVKVTGKASSRASRQLVQQVAVKAETKYVLTFEAKSAAAEPQEVGVVLVRKKNTSEPHYGLYRKAMVKGEWEKITFRFTTTALDPEDPAMLKFQLGSITSDLMLRGIELVPAGS